MSNVEIGRFIHSSLDVAFRWRQADGHFKRPRDMQTTHLFYVIRMIWNHSMPEEARSANYKRYHFGEFYTRKYMIQALLHIGIELGNREDLSREHETELRRMCEYLREHPRLVIED